MTLKKLLSVLYQYDEMGQWLFHVSQLGEVSSLTLYRARQAQIIGTLARGWVYFPRARSLPGMPLDRFALEVRRPHITYASLESELARNGWISQLPMVETYVTTGREARFDTPLGNLELVHTKKEGILNAKDIYWSASRNIWVATPERAFSDLHDVGRNLGLISKPL